jgi:hypothetical protein
MMEQNSRRKAYLAAVRSAYAQAVTSACSGHQEQGAGASEGISPAEPTSDHYGPGLWRVHEDDPVLAKELADDCAARLEFGCGVPRPVAEALCFAAYGVVIDG